MRKYTLSLLMKLSPDGKPIEDRDILAWANKKLKDGQKDTFSSFQDKKIRKSQPVIDLIDCIKPQTIDASLVKPGANEAVRMSKNPVYLVTV